MINELIMGRGRDDYSHGDLCPNSLGFSKPSKMAFDRQEDINYQSLS